MRKDTGEHVEADEIIRGFEVDKGRLVERKELFELLRANAKEPGDDRADAEVVDLMAVLRESVEPDAAEETQAGSEEERPQGKLVPLQQMSAGFWPAITRRAAASSVASIASAMQAPCVLASLGARDPEPRQHSH